MNRISMTSAIVFAALASYASMATAGEYGDKCALGVAFGKSVPTDCKVNLLIKDKTYCFSSEASKALFLEDTKGNIEKADAFAGAQK
jgi:hypothetical protein